MGPVIVAGHDVIVYGCLGFVDKLVPKVVVPPDTITPLKVEALFVTPSLNTIPLVGKVMLVAAVKVIPQVYAPEKVRFPATEIVPLLFMPVPP
jgi:hypothetical protein